AEHAIADERPERVGNGAHMLDGEIGDAAPRIERVGVDEGAGGAGVETGAAFAATWGFRCRRGAFEIQQKLAQDQPAAGAGCDHDRVFADEADAAQLRRLPLEKRRGVDAGAPGDWVSAGSGDALGEPLEFAFEEAVVIDAPGITRDGASWPS